MADLEETFALVEVTGRAMVAQKADIRDLAALTADRIRVNAICPTTVDTPMIHNDATNRLFFPHIENPTRDDFASVTQNMQALPFLGSSPSMPQTLCCSWRPMRRATSPTAGCRSTAGRFKSNRHSVRRTSGKESGPCEFKQRAVLIRRVWSRECSALHGANGLPTAMFAQAAEAAAPSIAWIEAQHDSPGDVNVQVMRR